MAVMEAAAQGAVLLSAARPSIVNRRVTAVPDGQERESLAGRTRRVSALVGSSKQDSQAMHSIVDSLLQAPAPLASLLLENSGEFPKDTDDKDAPASRASARARRKTSVIQSAQSIMQKRSSQVLTPFAAASHNASADAERLGPLPWQVAAVAAGAPLPSDEPLEKLSKLLRSQPEAQEHVRTPWVHHTILFGVALVNTDLQQFLCSSQ